MQRGVRGPGDRRSGHDGAPGVLGILVHGMARVKARVPGSSGSVWPSKVLSGRKRGIQMQDGERRRLRKLGREFVEKQSAELEADLARLNPAKFESDESVRNEIELRKRGAALRESDQVLDARYVRKQFLVRARDFDYSDFYPSARLPSCARQDPLPHLCSQCGELLDICQEKPKCRCGTGFEFRNGGLFEREIRPPSVHCVFCRTIDWPRSDRLWECRSCGEFLPKATTHDLSCRCGNVRVNGLRGYFAVHDEGLLRSAQLMARIAPKRPWWRWW